MAEVKTAESKPFIITVGGTKSYGITNSTYTKDGNVVRGANKGESATFDYFVEVDEATYDKVDVEANKTTRDIVRQTASLLGAQTVTKYYRRVATFDKDGKFQETEYTEAALKKEFANYATGKPTPLTTVTANSNITIAAAENIDVKNQNLNQTRLSRNLGSVQSQVDEAVKKGLEGKLDSININVGEAKVRKKYGNYYYPLDMKDNGQDRIIFTMRQSEGSTINPNLGQKTITRTKTKEGVIEGSVTLPIQPSISDRNSVDWQGNNLNAVGAFAAGTSLNLMGSDDFPSLAENAQKILGSISKELRNSDAYGNALKVYLAQEAVGIQGLLSRASGAILNPNMELLFNAPSLRPFTFTFKLSPRSETEATQVKNIIRFFKQGMSVKTTETSVFLKAPNVFDIRYQSYDKNGNPIKNHPSLNRIKTCALTACDVNYTPDGTYMTFNDDKRTMTSYELSLRFTELDPVYDEDYTAIDNDPSTSENIKSEEIGY